MEAVEAVAAFVAIALAFIGQIVVMAFWARGQSAKSDQNARDISALAKVVEVGLGSKLSLEQGRAIEDQMRRQDVTLAQAANRIDRVEGEQVQRMSALQSALSEIKATLAGLQAQVTRILEAEDRQAAAPASSPLDQLRNAVELMRMVKGLQTG